MANEKRLIDANALKEDFRRYMADRYDSERCVSEENCITCGRVCLFQRTINNAPTVDAVEVVHGHWHIDDYDSGEPDGYAAFIEVHCSKCGYELGAESGQYGWAYGDPFPLNYCPNCGAKMDGERQ